jgi:hypothetical protein
MRRLIAWIVGGLVVAGGTFGVFAAVEASMASASPSAACLQAQRAVEDARYNLFFLEEFSGILSYNPTESAQLRVLIGRAEEALSAAEEAESSACNTIVTTSTGIMTSSKSESSSFSETVTLSESTNT